METVPAMPSHADALAGLPLSDVSADGINAPCNFVPWHARILNSRPVSLFHQGVAVADAAGLHLDANLSSARFWNRTFNDFEISTWFADLYGFHEDLSC